MYFPNRGKHTLCYTELSIIPNCHSHLCPIKSIQIYLQKHFEHKQGGRPAASQSSTVSRCVYKLLLYVWMCVCVCVTGGGVNEYDSGGAAWRLVRTPPQIQHGSSDLVTGRDSERSPRSEKQGARQLEQIVPAAVMSSIRSSDLTDRVLFYI